MEERSNVWVKKVKRTVNVSNCGVLETERRTDKYYPSVMWLCLTRDNRLFDSSIMFCMHKSSADYRYTQQERTVLNVKHTQHQLHKVWCKTGFNWPTLSWTQCWQYRPALIMTHCLLVHILQSTNHMHLLQSILVLLCCGDLKRKHGVIHSLRQSLQWNFSVSLSGSLCFCPLTPVTGARHWFYSDRPDYCSWLAVFCGSGGALENNYAPKMLEDQQVHAGPC